MMSPFDAAGASNHEHRGRPRGVLVTVTDGCGRPHALEIAYNDFVPTCLTRVRLSYGDPAPSKALALCDRICGSTRERRLHSWLMESGSLVSSDGIYGCFKRRKGLRNFHSFDTDGDDLLDEVQNVSRMAVVFDPVIGVVDNV